MSPVKTCSDILRLFKAYGRALSKCLFMYMFRTKRKVTLQQPEKPHVYTVPRGIMHCINHSDFTVVIIRMFTVSVPDSLSCSILLHILHAIAFLRRSVRHHFNSSHSSLATSASCYILIYVYTLYTRSDHPCPRALPYRNQCGTMPLCGSTHAFNILESLATSV